MSTTRPSYRDKLKEAGIAEFDIPSIRIFYSDPPLPPMSGNSRSSFDHLLYDATTGMCLAILEYPYG
jgi:hypothetical protein